jgi:DNA-binding IclR family transcriptional regulator
MERVGAGDVVKSAQRSLDILELITSRETGLTFNEIGEELSVPRSSLHGLLVTLAGSGWIQFDSSARTYWLGIRTLEAGNAYMRRLSLPEEARPHMHGIREALDETVQLSVLDGRYNVYIAKVDGRQALALASAVGRRLPAHATGVGKVLLAGLPPGAVESLLCSVELECFTDKTLTDHAALQARLETIRTQGYASDDEEFTIGVRCVAVPIRDQTGDVVAAMSVSAPSIRFDEQRSNLALRLLLSAASNLSTAMGFQASSPESG